MRKRRIYLVLLILAVAGVVGLIVAVAFREREPEYGGKKLSKWVEMTKGRSSFFFMGNALHMTMDVGRNDAILAIREIGTNATPYFLDWIGYEPPSWKTKTIALVNRFLGLGLVDHRLKRADGAVAGLCILGEEARGADARLHLLAEDRTAPITAMRASGALAYLQFILKKQMEVFGH